LRLALIPTHEAFTVSYLGWSSLENGSLLSQAAASGFDALITKDQGIEHQQNMSNLPLSVVVIRARTNKIDDIRPLIPELLSVLASLTPRSLVQVG